MIMKNYTKFLCLLMTGWFLILSVGGCQKNVSPQTDGNILIPMKSDSREGSHVLVFFAGHDGKNCPGCIMIGGNLYHVECQGAGTKCRKSSMVSIVKSGADFTATTTDTFALTSEDYFLMPARSLHYLDSLNNPIYLNIPGQLLFRDSTTQQFTFTGLSFSNRPIY